jgi:RNA polymerase sigma-70 factor, ECF subfamily
MTISGSTPANSRRAAWRLRRRAQHVTIGSDSPNKEAGASMEAEFKALMIAAQAGDAVAQRRLLTLLAGRLRAFYARRLASDDVEDLVQEALLAIHLKRATYDPRFEFGPWAFAIARYKLIDHFRRTGARKTTPLEDAGELLAADNPEEGAVRRDLSKLLSKLSPRQRALMRDVKLEGYSMEEAADRAGMTVGAAKVGVHRAMRRLMKEVDDEDL